MEPERSGLEVGQHSDGHASLLRSIRAALWIIAALLAALLVVVYVGFDNVTGV